MKYYLIKMDIITLFVRGVTSCLLILFLKSKVQEDLVKGNIYNDSYTKVLKNKVNIKLNNLKFQYGLQKNKNEIKKIKEY